jgi:hypothetical protein
MSCLNSIKADLVFVRGIDFLPVEFQLCDEDEDPIDYTGYTIESEARLSVDSAVAFTMGVSWVNAAIGLYRISKTGSQTLSCDVGKYGYDVVLVTSGGVRLPPVVTAKVRVVNNFTQPTPP